MLGGNLAEARTQDELHLITQMVSQHTRKLHLQYENFIIMLMCSILFRFCTVQVHNWINIYSAVKYKIVI